MSLRADAPAPPGTRVHRFTRAERWVHRTTAALMGVCVVTAACLYIPQLAELVGRRELVVRVHECAGLALPVPVLLGLASRAFRADLRFLNRFGRHDQVWLRAALRRDRRPPPARPGSSTPARRSTPPGSPGPAWSCSARD